MNKLQKARWRNILHKAAKVNHLIKKGYIVYDQHGHKCDGFKFDNSRKMLYEGDDKFRVVLVALEEGWDSALEKPIKEYNTQKFDKFTCIHPKNIEKL